MSQPITYHYTDVEGHGTTLQAQAGSLELTHRQILNDRHNFRRPIKRAEVRRNLISGHIKPLGER